MARDLVRHLSPLSVEPKPGGGRIWPLLGEIAFIGGVLATAAILTLLLVLPIAVGIGIFFNERLHAIGH